MTRFQAILALWLAAFLVASVTGCASSSGSSNEYYRRGSVHRDSFPPGYVPGRHRTYGRPVLY